MHFTKSVQDLEEFIPRDRIPKELDGDEDWKYTYPEPVPGENDLKKDTATRDSIIAQRKLISDEFENITLAMVAAAHAKNHELVSSHKEKRADVIKQLQENYWQLDPYIRAVSLYDRLGILQPGGKVDFYPQKATNDVKGVNGVNGTAKVTVNGAS